MLGTIEDLERDIDQFQRNVAASNEMYTLLSQMLEQIHQQNTSFDSKSIDLLDRLDGIPAAMDTANATSNAAVKKEVSAEVDRAINNFSQEQDKYVQLLEQVKQQIQLYIDQSKAQTAAFGDKTSLLVAKVEGIPASVDAANNASNAQMRTDVKNELEVGLEPRGDHLRGPNLRYRLGKGDDGDEDQVLDEDGQVRPDRLALKPLRERLRDAHRWDEKLRHDVGREGDAGVGVPRSPLHGRAREQRRTRVDDKSEDDVVHERPDVPFAHGVPSGPSRQKSTS